MNRWGVCLGDCSPSKAVDVCEPEFQFATSLPRQSTRDVPLPLLLTHSNALVQASCMHPRHASQGERYGDDPASHSCQALGVHPVLVRARIVQGLLDQRLQRSNLLLRNEELLAGKINLEAKSREPG